MYLRNAYAQLSVERCSGSQAHESKKARSLEDPDSRISWFETLSFSEKKNAVPWWSFLNLLTMMTNHSMTADASDNFTKPPSDLKAWKDRPVHASGK